MTNTSEAFDHFITDYYYKIEELADEITNFTVIKNKFLNRDAMKDAVEEKLSLFIIDGNYDFDTLADDPNFEDSLDDTYFYDEARKIFLGILLGIKPDRIGHYRKTLIIKDTAGSEEIADLIKETLVELVNDYKEFIGDKTKL